MQPAKSNSTHVQLRLHRDGGTGIILLMQIDPQTRALLPRIYQAARQVPRGQVTTYGDVATIVGQGCDARIAGYAMANCPDDVPWQRVINAQGKISLRSGDGSARQRMRLEAEGVVFDQRGKIDLERYRWAGPGAEWAAANGFNTLPPSQTPSQPGLF
jgi:methylated-DNA-protein-cysteine methyltransferase related protein